MNVIRRAAAAALLTVSPALPLAQDAAPVPLPGTSAPPAAPTPAAPAAAARAPEPVTFAEAVRRAGLQATSVSIAAEEVRRAEALLVQARAGSLPLLTANGSYTRLDADRTTAPGAPPIVARDQLNANATLQVPVLAPSRWASWAVAKELTQVARASGEDVRRTAVLTAARAYLSILAGKRVVEVSRSARDIAQARVDFAQARLSGGIGNAVDALRAEQQLATAEVNLQRGQLGVAQAQEALGLAAGMDVPLDAAEDPAFAVGGDVAGAEERRLDVRAARERVAGAELARRYSWTDWLPTLFATAQASANDPATVTQPTTGWQIQFLLSLPLFEGGFRIGQLREREAIEREARLQLDAALRQVHSDVRVATEEIARNEQALESARVAAERARRTLRLVGESYRAGAANDLDVTTAQQQSRDADLNVVIAEDAVRQSRLDLLSAVGRFP